MRLGWGGGQAASCLIMSPRVPFLGNVPPCGQGAFVQSLESESTWLNVFKYNSLLVAEYQGRENLKIN